jgi:hypothetical protein
MLDTRLEMALKELVAQEVGAKAMSAALLKQVIVALMRRSLSSLNLWVERFHYDRVCLCHESRQVCGRASRYEQGKHDSC